MGGPVYSERTQCHDCYKCVRQCPVKAIRVAEGHAVVMPERCIACGTCVAACPSGAKRVRQDLDGVRELVAGSAMAAASLAPSFVSEFPGVAPERLVAALRALGFTHVSETALGAEQVSARLAKNLDQCQSRILLSTACPVAVDLVIKFRPDLVELLSPLQSPLLAHARLLKAGLGQAVPVVFFGPCIGKKLESARHPELLAAALTFQDLRDWLAREGVRLEELQPGPEDRFAPRRAREGALYPVEGGMAEATRLNMRREGTRFVTVSGVDEILTALADLPRPGRENVFLELLACKGGCVRGPKASRRSPVAARMAVLDYALPGTGPVDRPVEVPLGEVYGAAPCQEARFEEERILKVLKRIGKRTPEDQLNCGACGYDTCRDLAAAILDGRGEGRMCVSNMRNLAQKKANALLRTLPFGVVILDEHLEVIECNDTFVDLLDDDAKLVNEAQPGLAGAHVEKLLPFAQRFREVLESGEEIIRENIRVLGRTLSVTIFTVEPQRVVGALLLDVTEVEDRRQQVIEKAQQVIQNMLANVQDIAFSLGRNAANSEGILNSIIAEFQGGAHDA
jgi:iron only hydrogenase large subunit-like protein/uncharacterized Fe-S cluster-containing protein